jgi:hypothetical protein
MSDRAKKITELTALTAPSADDLMVIVDSPSGTPVTKYVTVGNFLGNSAANVTIFNTTTPANSTITVKKGTIMFDSSFLYIATANNTLKRVALTAF